MRILLAPMEGLLDHILRDTLTRLDSFPGQGDGTGAAGCGVDLCVTEFIRITNSLLPRAAFHRIAPELQQGCRTAAGVPVRVQLLGSDPVCMAENAAKLATLGAYEIDVNFGCPANTVNRHRGGAVLLKEPEVMHAIVAAMRRAVPAHIPVTAKMRLGYDTPEHAIDCAQALADGGAAEIVVHARTKTDGYKPPAYWEWLARIREAVSVPIVANGEIWTAADAQRCRDISGCSDIMIGRGMVANPALARMIRQPDAPQPQWEDLRPLLRQFWTTVSLHVSARHRNGRIKQWLLYLARHYPQAQHQFDAIKRLIDPEAISHTLFDSPFAVPRPRKSA